MAELTINWVEDISKDDFSIFASIWGDVVFGLQVNGEIVAIADTQNIDYIDEVEEEDWIEIHNFGVKVKGQGYGRMLVEMLQERFSSIEAHEVLNEAKGFWAKMGFESVEDDTWIWKR